MPILDMGSISAYVFGLFLISVFAWVFIKPMKWLLRVLLNSVFGAVLLFLINLTGGIFGLHIGLNVINALVVGILGIPGAVMLIILQYIL